MRDNELKPARMKRHFLPDDLIITRWEDVQPWFEDLQERDIRKTEEMERWLTDRSELAFVLEEELAWRYIRMNCHTDNKEYAALFETFVSEIEPEISRWSDKLDEKFLSHPLSSQLDREKYKVLLRTVKNRHDLFREENVPLKAELEVLEQEYGKIASQMTVILDGKELTLQQASNYLKEPERALRKKAFLKITQRRLEDAETLQKLFTTLIEKRSVVAHNAGFDNYRDYRFAELGRFDYNVSDCEEFHESIRQTVIPLVEEMHTRRRELMKTDKLRPYDLKHDPLGRPPLKPFNEVKELVEKTSEAFSRVNPLFGALLRAMNRKGYLDLDSRKNKAPGGFNYPLYESNLPFIYMNATGNLRDVETLFHEGGHAIHSWLSREIRLIEYKELPSEVAELASMSMELISMDQWDVFFPDRNDLLRAKKEQLEGIIHILPWIAAIDKFQHWLYTHPGHSHEERNNAWMKLMKDFSSSLIDWSGFEKYQGLSWQTQLHLFEVPFYYIEYGIAQLGAIAIWKNYRSDPEKTIRQYMDALSLGYSHPIPEIYKAAGIRFDFSLSYVRELIFFLKNELERL